MELILPSGQVIRLDRSLSLGRSPDNDVLIDDPLVSRHHARIHVKAGQVFIEDLGSANGTRVNGMRITGLHPLRPGDQITIGNTVLTVRSAGAAPSKAHPTGPLKLVSPRGQEYALDRPLILGRSPSADIMVSDPLVSRRHARFYVQAGQVFIEDLGSANGTRVNGMRITGPQLLHPGDQVSVGQTTFIVQPGAPAPVSPPAPTWEPISSPPPARPEPSVPPIPPAQPRRSSALWLVLGAIAMFIMCLCVGAVGVAVYVFTQERTPTPVVRITPPLPTNTTIPTVTPRSGVFPTPTPTSEGEVTPIPTLEPSLGPIAFSQEATSDNQPINPQTTFPAGVRRVRATFEHHGLRPGITLRREWYLDGELKVAGEEVWKGLPDGRYGYELYTDDGSPLFNGQYELRLYLNGELKQRASFTVGQ